MHTFTIAAHLLRRTIGNVRGFFTYILLPALIISGIIGLFGADSADTQNDVHYVNLDDGFLGEHVVNEVRKTSFYKLHPVESVTLLQELVMNRKSNTTFVIPKDFTRSLLEGKESNVKMYQLNRTIVNHTLLVTLKQAVKGTQQAVSWSRQASGHSLSEREAHLKAFIERQQQQAIKVKITDNRFYVLANQTKLSEINGIMLLFIMGLIGKAVTLIVEDRAQRTMSRIYLAPVRSFDIAAGNFLGSFAMGTMQIFLMLSITRYLLDFNFGMSFVSQFSVLECFLLATMGMSSAIAGVVKNTYQLGQIFLLFIIPTSMLGGCFWSVKIMPEFMQKLANAVPQKWAIQALDHLRAGESILAQGWELGILILFGFVFLSFGSSILQPGKAETQV